MFQDSRLNDADVMSTVGSRHRSRFQKMVSRTARDCIADMFKVKGSNQRIRMQARFVRTTKMRERVVELLDDLCSGMHVKITQPEMGVLPPSLSAHASIDWIERDNLRFADELIAQMASDKVGRVVWTGDHSLQYSFHEVSQNNGLWTNKLERMTTKHDLINPRANRMPADGIDMPRKAQKMINRIMREDHQITRHFAVYTGQLAAKQSGVSETWTEDGVVKKIATSTAAKATGAAALAAGGLAALFSTLGPIAAVAVVDPAIVLGDVCFFGWE